VTPPPRIQSLVRASDEVAVWIASLAAPNADTEALERLAVILEAGAVTAREIARRP
jgi:hypothetical protein